MKHLSYLAVLVVAMFMASCAVNSTVSYTASIDAQNQDLQVTPMIATLQVEPTHATGEFQWNGNKRAVVNYDELKDNAIFNALKKRHADVLIAPQYQIVTELRGSSKTVKVSVLGYPAKYVDFKKAPKPESLDIKEIQADANYVLVMKDASGAVYNYQVVLPYDKDMKTLSLDEATVEKIILDGNKAKIGKKKAPAAPANTGIFGKLGEKLGKKNK